MQTDADRSAVLLVVDERLRFTLYGVSVLLDINLSPIEIERLFSASLAGESVAREYELHRSPHAVVAARTDAHEPESIWLSVQARRFSPAAMARLVATADHASFGRHVVAAAGPVLMQPASEHGLADVR